MAFDLYIFFILTFGIVRAMHLCSHSLNYQRDPNVFAIDEYCAPLQVQTHDIYIYIYSYGVF